MPAPVCSARVATLRAAIIGYGLAGRVFHASLIAATPGLEVAVIMTASPERVSQAVQDHPRARIVPDLDAVWASAPDLVVVATPNDTHASIASAAIERGIAVVVDKPLAVSAAQAHELVAAAQRAGVLLTAFQNRRWDSDQLTLRALMDQGALGEVVRYESRFERWRPEPQPEAWRERAAPSAGGGQLLDLGSHLVDQALVLFGPVTHVYAEIESRRGLAGDDDVFIALRHASGPISHLHAGAVMPAPGPRLRVQGSRGGFLVNALDPQEAALRRGDRPDTTPAWGQGEEWERGRLVAGERSVPVQGQPGDWPRFYILLEQALREGGPAPVDPHDAVVALRVLEAARESAAARQTVAFDAAAT
jgi:predicted dehydrogenase